jgi:hypothetical protein
MITQNNNVIVLLILLFYNFLSNLENLDIPVILLFSDNL